MLFYLLFLFIGEIIGLYFFVSVWFVLLELCLTLCRIAFRDVDAKRTAYNLHNFQSAQSSLFILSSSSLLSRTGNVWFDYPDHRKTGCIAQDMLHKLQIKDSKEKPYFDWKFTHSRHKICIRLSEAGASAKDDLFFTRV